jgi:Bacteriophage baseplate protein W
MRRDRGTDAPGDGTAEGGGDVNLAFPYAFDPTGRTATTDDVTHIHDLIAQVLFTAPGERVMRPDFGSGLLALTFAPNSVEVGATVQFLIQAALQQWLGTLIAVDSVEVDGEDGQLSIGVTYAILRTRQQVVDQFTASGVGS